MFQTSRRVAEKEKAHVHKTGLILAAAVILILHLRSTIDSFFLLFQIVMAHDLLVVVFTTFYTTTTCTARSVGSFIHGGHLVRTSTRPWRRTSPTKITRSGIKTISKFELFALDSSGKI